MNAAFEWIRELLSGALTIDLVKLLASIKQIVNNPLSNPQATLLLVGAVIITLLLAVLITVYFVGFRRRDEYVIVTTLEGGEPVGLPEVSSSPPASDVAGEESTARTMSERAIIVAGVIVAVLVVWLLVGAATSPRALCLSCHGDSTPHSSAESARTDNPHASLACASCHEAGGLIGSLTTHVPGRIAHAVTGLLDGESKRGYRGPVSSSACLACHAEILDGVFVNEEQGWRVSHAQPVEAGALCVDCHILPTPGGALTDTTVGMSACMRCHNGVDERAECSLCHDDRFEARWR